MQPFLHDEFHQLTKNKKLSQLGTHDTESIEIKVYERFTPTPLPEPFHTLPTLDTVLTTRKSVRGEILNNISLEVLSSILYYSAAIVDPHALGERGRRPVASAGAKYPLELYVVTLLPLENLPSGIHHYRPDLHALEHISPQQLSAAEVHALFREEAARHFQIAIFITGIFKRTTLKYGERGYRYVLLEAGAIGQAIQNASTAMGIDSLMCGGVLDENVEKLLAIDGVTESLVHTVLLK